jgi:hypothetical protein
MQKDLLMLGSVPFETPEEVFKTCGGALGKHMPCMPDGETDERIWWVNMLAYRVYHGHPDIDTLIRPAKIDGVERWRPATLAEVWKFKVKDGVEDVKFGDPGWRLGYAKDALYSYYLFRALRKEGVLPPEMRFQVCVPLTNSALDWYFENPADYDKINPGYEAALRAEIAKMAGKIPHVDLAIQIDACFEMLDLEGVIPWTPKTGVLERSVRPVGEIAPHIPKDVMLGYHLCYGTLGGWPMVSPKSLRNAVDFANEAVARSGRRVDYVNIPVLNTTDESYYAPLRDLNVGNTAVYFGVIHNMESSDAFKQRLRLLKKYIPEFGIASPCGFGRHRADQVPGLLEDHLRAADLLAKLN